LLIFIILVYIYEIGASKVKKIKESNWLSDLEKKKRLITLISLEIERIIFDLEFRKDILFKLWSKERLRKPLINVLKADFLKLDFEMLILLSDDLVKKLNEFYRILDDFLFYVSYTEDMPQTMRTQFDHFVTALKKKKKNLLELLKEEVKL
jgi:hypothetical protein